jgi:hypothetical protein
VDGKRKRMKMTTTRRELHETKVYCNCQAIELELCISDGVLGGRYHGS